jgi:hypothetical protein
VKDDNGGDRDPSAGAGEGCSYFESRFVFPPVDINATPHPLEGEIRGEAQKASHLAH